MTTIFNLHAGVPLPKFVPVGNVLGTEELGHTRLELLSLDFVVIADFEKKRCCLLLIKYTCSLSFAGKIDLFPVLFW